MQTGILSRTEASGRSMAPPPLYEDPIDADAAGDVAVTTTVRGIGRIALVAAQAAARFAGEDSPHDPMAWMLAPRRLFGGRNALDACLEREPCMRAMLLHGLALGLDADPEDLDDLFGEGDDADGAEVVGVPPSTGRKGGGAPAGERDGRPRLHTATVVYRGEGVLLHAFHASVAAGPDEIAARLRARYGAVVAAGATITAGFDRTHGFAMALVAPALADLLENVDGDPASAVAGGLDLNLEQRMDA